MSAETLRRAARELRATVRGAAPGTVSDPDFKLAVADWLDDTAESWEMASQDQRFRLATENIVVGYGRDKALAVARAYLGESA